MLDNNIVDHRRIEPIKSRDVIFASVICLVTIVIFVIIDVRIMHWCLFPLLLSGILIGIDAMRWFRGGVDTFDPKGVIGMFGLNFFFLAPLLVLLYGADYSNYGGSPSDWRPWIGRMACFNVMGIIIYQLTQWFTFRHCRPSKKVWLIRPGQGYIFMLGVIMFCVISRAIVLVKMGGIAGIVTEHFYKVGAKAGLGTFIFFATSLMPLVLITLTAQRRTHTRANILTVCIILFIFCIIHFSVTGFIGTRRKIIYPIVWAVGIIHYFWRDISAKNLLVGMIPLVLFAFIYGVYKAGRESFLDIFRGYASFSQVVESTNESIGQVLVGDMSRADIQAWMMYKWYVFLGDYEPRYGKTYLWAPITLRPSWIFKEKIPHSEKTIAGTDYMYGPGYFEPHGVGRVCLKVYGLAGEAILNFGPLGIPFAFCAFGLYVGYFRAKWISWPAGDSRLLLAPIFVIVAVMFVNMGSDNIWAVVYEHITVPLVTIFVVSSRTRLTDKDRALFDADSDYEFDADALYQDSDYIHIPG